LKEKITAAVADEGREETRYYGMILYTPEAIRKITKKLGDLENLKMNCH